MKKMAYIKIILMVWLLLFSRELCIQAEENNPDEKADMYLRKAFEGKEAGDDRKREFWLGRFIGEVTVNPKTTRTWADMQALVDSLPLKLPQGSLSANYHESFRQWFSERSRGQWAVSNDRANETDHTIEMGNGSGLIDRGFKATYFAAVFASPRVLGWSVGHQDQILVFASEEQKPLILSGELIPGDYCLYYNMVELDTGGKKVQTFWAPKFEDLDGDKIPEVFFRYNVVDGDHFDQELAIYKFVGSSPVFYKKFVGRNGGLAHKLEGKRIQVANGDSDPIELETWEFTGNDFVIQERTRVPNIYMSEEWKNYYFPDERLF